MRWESNEGILGSMNRMAEVLEKQFGVEAKTVAYTGGVPGMQIKLPYRYYGAAKSWLLGEFGQPEEKDQWHPDQSKDVRPLRFKTDSSLVDHVNLISMMQRADKRHVIISWC